MSNYFKSEHVKVFPSAYRGKNANDEWFDKRAIQLTEKNLIHTGGFNNFTDSYVLDYKNNILYCVISGYYFEITIDEYINTIGDQKLYVTLTAGDDSHLSSFQEGAEVLDQEIDTVYKFTGLTWSSEKPTGASSELQPFVNNDGTITVNNAALLPNIYSGAGAHSIILNKDTSNNNVSEVKEASGNYATVAGYNTKALGDGSFAQGYNTQASGDYSHSEGNNTIASGENSHAEGEGNGTDKGVASGRASHSEGYQTEASNIAAHAEGNITVASGEGAHAEGNNTEASGQYSHSEGDNTDALGKASHAEGNTTVASGNYSHTEGADTEATAANAHAEGYDTHANGPSSHTEGIETVATGTGAHAEGNTTIASGNDSHAEGQNTLVNNDGIGAHAEGYETIAGGKNAHTEGKYTKATGEASHAEGGNDEAEEGEQGYNEASGKYSHVEGTGTIANSLASHAEGKNTEANGEASHAEGDTTEAAGQAAHSEGYKTRATGKYAHAEGENFGNYINADGQAAHSEGYHTKASGAYSHAEGLSTKAIGEGAHAAGLDTKAYGRGSHAEGCLTETNNEAEASHAEGYDTRANGQYSHSEGNTTVASGTNAHSEGKSTTAAGNNAHSEGELTTASNINTHTEGYQTTASGVNAHSEGDTTVASGKASHAEGEYTVANGEASHAEGIGTIAHNPGETVVGKYNEGSVNDKRIFVVGSGTDDNHRSNALEVLLNQQNGISNGVDLKIGGMTLKTFVHGILLDLVYPVGSFYTSSEINGNTKEVPGKAGCKLADEFPESQWERIQGVMLYAAEDPVTTNNVVVNENYTMSHFWRWDSSTNKYVRKTVQGGAFVSLGSKDAVVVNHTHNNGLTGEAGKHTHGPGNLNITGTFPGVGYEEKTHNQDFTGAFSHSGNSHVKVENSGGGVDWLVSFSAASHWSGETAENTKVHSHTIKAEGVAGTDRNMPPYLCVYVWRRIK